MYIGEVLDYLKCGKKIRRSCWLIGFSIDRKSVLNLSAEDLLADDWEILEEKEEKYKWWEPKEVEEDGRK